MNTKSNHALLHHTQYIISYQSNQNKYCNKVRSYKYKQVNLHNFDGNTLFFILPKVRVFFDRRPMVFQSFLIVMGQRTSTRMVVKNNEIFIFPRTITLPYFHSYVLQINFWSFLLLFGKILQIFEVLEYFISFDGKPFQYPLCQLWSSI